MKIASRFFLGVIILWSAFARAQSNLVIMISPPGDWVGQGQTYVATSESEFFFSGSAKHVAVSLAGFGIEFDSPADEDFTVRRYTNAVRYPFNGALPGITISGNGRGCNTVVGEFEILELRTDTNGIVDRFWARFTHSCEGTMPAITGEARYHSALAPPIPTGRTLRVPEEYSTIQAAINAGSYLGDTVLVGAGVYREAVNFRGKRIVVRSANGPVDTAIIPPSGSAGVTFASGEPREAELVGFTIRDAAGGVAVSSASPTITGNVITNCGYGVSCYFSSPFIRSNYIVASKGGGGGLGSGSGVHLQGAANAVIENNVIEGNINGITMWAAGSPLIRNNYIWWNRGDGLNMVNQSDADIIQNVIAENNGNGIAWLVPSGARGPLVRQNTIADNGRVNGAGISADGFDAASEIANNIIVGNPALSCGGFNDNNPPIVRFNDVFSPFGSAYAGLCGDLTGLDGNISADPLFVDSTTGDYHLQTGSPAIDVGASDPDIVADLDGNPRPTDGMAGTPVSPDLGAFEFPGPPGPPVFLQAVSTPTNVLLNWRPSIGAATYVIGRSTVSGGPYDVIVTVTGTNHSDGAVIANRVYYYVIAGANGLGVGPYSTEISIKAGNRPPVAAADLFRVDEDTNALIQPMTNDSDPDGDPLTLELLSQPATGLAVVTNEFVLYVTAPDFVGTNNFAYRIHDGRGGYATGVVMVIVVPVNDPPTAVTTDFVVPGNTRSTRQLHGTDIDSTQLRFFLTRVPDHGLAVVDQTSGQLFYQPAHGFFGTDTLGFMVTDGQTNSAEATARLFVERPVDLDGDGMDDAWENLWDLNNPLNDPDGDGVMNRDEYFANTSPRDPNSVLRLLNVGHDPQGRPVISWSSVGGTRYRIFFADQLTGTATSDFREIIRSTSEEIDPTGYGTASVQSFVDTTPPPPSGRRFYRIGVVP